MKNLTPHVKPAPMQISARNLFEQHRHMAFVVGDKRLVEWSLKHHEAARSNDGSPWNTRGWHWRPHGHAFQRKGRA
jgi:hypothetical protein